MAHIHHVEHVMGLPVVVDIYDSGSTEAALGVAINWLHWVDRHFSTYLPESEISRLNHGELRPENLHPVVSQVLARCEEFRVQTGGWFDIRAPYAQGRRGPAAGRGGEDSVEPSGFVKGWAVAEAMRRLKIAGAEHACINAGGDVVTCGHPDDSAVWRIGVRHPRITGQSALALALTDGAVATSGAYERGDHIVDPFTSATPQGLLSVTIVGPDLVAADVYATAAFAMGAQRAATWCAGLSLSGYEAILIAEDDTVLSTPGIDALRI